MSPLLKGLIIGFSIAAPVGPIGLLCIRRSIADGRTAGFLSGLGAATADSLYGLVAALGLGAITSLLIAQRQWLQLGGGLFLVYLGLSTLRSRPASEAASARPARNLFADYFSVFALTLTNPLTILSFIGIFAGVGLDPGRGGLDAAQLVFGVFLGSACWWLILSFLAGWLGARVQRGGLRAINLLSGLILLAFGLRQLALLLP